jgi:dolichyl-phosphate-mannose--protein O-mannosyl transferase
MNIKLSNSLKIKLNNSGQGSGANFDYDFQIIVIDKTKKPYKKKLLSRQDMIRIHAPLNGSCAMKTIDDFIEWAFCINSPLYIEFRNDPTKNWNIEKQQWETIKQN